MTAVSQHKLWIDGTWQESGETHEIRSPYSDQTVARSYQASSAQMEQALAASHNAFKAFRRVSRGARSRLLHAMSVEIEARRAELVSLLVAEAGKPAGMAEIEVTRAVSTFLYAAEEAKRFGGEVIPIDTDPTAKAYAPAVSYWVPRGPVLGITPFNFPLNLVAHKVAPALAAGTSILIKSAPQAPGPAAVLAEIFEKAAKASTEAIPLSVFQVVSCSNEVASSAVTDSRIATMSFTGSASVGWMLQQKAVGKRVSLELGGNAAVIIHSDGDLERAAQRCVVGGFGYAGQTCISVQRIFVQKSVSQKFIELFKQATEKVGVGDPTKTSVSVGPVIDSKAADRIMSWIKDSNAKLLFGGTRQGNVIFPTALLDAHPDKKISCEEVFGPVVLVNTYDDFSEAIASVNNSKYGLQAGVFTDSARCIRQAINELEVGAILINEIPTYRADQMPYGGVKESGLGREGLRYAMEEYSERRTIIEWTG